jgi:hypothetical protein
MQNFRKFVPEGKDPFTCCEWVDVEVKVVDHRSGKVLFHIPKATVPKHWSKNAVQICVSKYFRLTDVPREVERIEETSKIKAISLPVWLQRSIPKPGTEFGGETSVKQLIHRMAGYWTYWGWRYEYFYSEPEAKAFYDECVHMLLRQWAAPSPSSVRPANAYPSASRASQWDRVSSQPAASKAADPWRISAIPSTARPVWAWTQPRRIVALQRRDGASFTVRDSRASAASRVARTSRRSWWSMEPDSDRTQATSPGPDF